jgi:hypothetical protein
MGATASVVEPLMEPTLAEMTVCPLAWPTAKPPELIVATAGAEEFQSALLVTSFVNPLAYLPVAVNCWFVPRLIMVFNGATLIETNGSCTARVVEPASEPDVAKILVVPKPALVASPCEPDVLLIVATVANEEAHATDVVMLEVVPSV